MKKKDTSKLEITRKPELHDEYRNHKTIKNAYRVTEYLFSVTGDDTVERRNYLYEKEYLKDVPAYIFKNYAVEEIWEKEHKKGDFEYSRRTETNQKFLCIGGPLNGKRSITSDAKEYRDFNAANFNRGRRRDDKNRVVLIHESLLV